MVLRQGDDLIAPFEKERIVADQQGIGALLPATIEQRGDDLLGGQDGAAVVPMNLAWKVSPILTCTAMRWMPSRSCADTE